MSGLFGQVAERFFGPTYGTDAQQWASDKLNAHLWSAQQDILRSVLVNRYTAVPSCHDAGKSFTAATCASWWLDTHPVGEAFVVSTAPTATQVSAILWREIERFHRRGNLRGRVNMGNQPEWWVEKELIGYGRKPSDYNQDAFQGIHARYVLVIVDEASGIPRQLWDAIDSLATNENARVLAIGNPRSSQSHFATICKPGSGWHTIHLDGLLTPNFTEAQVLPHPKLHQYMLDEEIPFATEVIPDRLREDLLSVQWVVERMDRWGINRILNEDGQFRWTTSPLWEEKVRGRFPADDTTGVIPLSWVQQAVDRWHRYDHNVEPIGQRIYGMDVAGTGDDETAVAQRTGHVLQSVETIGQPDTMAAVNRLRAKLTYPQSRAIIDVIGIGAGAYDRLVELGQPVEPFNASVRTDMTDSTGEFTFPNTRSAAWWNLRELLDPSAGSTLCIPDDDELIADLTAPRFHYGTGAKIIVEPKQESIKRLGHSPDRGDAAVMAFWAGGSPKASAQEGFSMDYGDPHATNDLVFAWGEGA